MLERAASAKALRGKNMITNFTNLLETAKQQTEPQRLLFLFAKTHEEPTPNAEGQTRGTITATMCVNKLPEELSTFDAFVAEADAISQEWDFIFVAGLPGKDGKAPTSEEAEEYLNQMTSHLIHGEDIDQYMIFDRSNHLVSIQPS
jgi:hypothetical protein